VRDDLDKAIREWWRGDSDPGDRDLRVRDCHGDIWTPQEVLGLGVRVWFTPETKPATWDHLLKKWGPVTEVPGVSSQGTPPAPRPGDHVRLYTPDDIITGVLYVGEDSKRRVLEHHRWGHLVDLPGRRIETVPTDTDGPQ
jgi:hypothetical protein